MYKYCYPNLGAIYAKGLFPSWKIGSRGPFLEGPEKFTHPERHSKISKLMITELFYSNILNINRGSQIQMN